MESLYSEDVLSLGAKFSQREWSPWCAMRQIPLGNKYELFSPNDAAATSGKLLYVLDHIYIKRKWLPNITAHGSSLHYQEGVADDGIVRALFYSGLPNSQPSLFADGIVTDDGQAAFSVRGTSTFNAGVKYDGHVVFKIYDVGDLLEFIQTHNVIERSQTIFGPVGIPPSEDEDPVARAFKRIIY